MPRPEAPIAFFDSGVGGLPYLASARRRLPGESLLYLADREGFPYGTKTREEVEAIVLDRVARLLRAQDPKVLVIACNTASQAALAATRRAFPGLPVIGTVPAVKPAAERGSPGAIGVMATARAVEDPYLDELVARHAPGRRVMRVAAQDLVTFVERRLPASSAEERRAAVLPHVVRLLDAGVDQIVLACTHFLHLAEDIASCASSLAAERGLPPVGVVDSRDGVARRLQSVLSERGLLASGEPSPGRCFLTGSGPFEPEYAAFCALFSLEGPFQLDGAGA